MKQSRPDALPCPPLPSASSLTGSRACIRNLSKGLRTLGWLQPAPDSPLHQLSFSSVLLPEAIRMQCSDVPFSACSTPSCRMAPPPHSAPPTPPFHAHLALTWLVHPVLRQLCSWLPGAKASWEEKG